MDEKDINKKFNNFQNYTGQLSDTVFFDLPPRFVANSSLIAIFHLFISSSLQSFLIPALKLPTP